MLFDIDVDLNLGDEGGTLYFLLTDYKLFESRSFHEVEVQTDENISKET